MVNTFGPRAPSWAKDLRTYIFFASLVQAWFVIAYTILGGVFSDHKGMAISNPPLDSQVWSWLWTVMFVPFTASMIIMPFVLPHPNVSKGGDYSIMWKLGLVFGGIMMVISFLMNGLGVVHMALRWHLCRGGSGNDLCTNEYPNHICTFTMMGAVLLLVQFVQFILWFIFWFTKKGKSYMAGAHKYEKVNGRMMGGYVGKANL